MWRLTSPLFNITEPSFGAHLCCNDLCQFAPRNIFAVFKVTCLLVPLYELTVCLLHHFQLVALQFLIELLIHGSIILYFLLLNFQLLFHKVMQLLLCNIFMITLTFLCFLSFLACINWNQYIPTFYGMAISKTKVQDQAVDWCLGVLPSNLTPPCLLFLLTWPIFVSFSVTVYDYFSISFKNVFKRTF